ncbi:hypothetical protein PENANT_c019G09522 [Penicillium antarcticum]|uniref:Uncharacterized protein n=1 Tax=Penicillium antarcticum TaxID=416450 RepID=A0A1V6Q2H7_9EURO|nr:uncharacterized protein N7508_001030 [Penicillium antarcticum]KAJ5316522.1 hypothetical protein N7508_001030 [Penicillium antarcticum]OQD82916.1 hypothetical protein PENANT_c019G09522 [Penicillium antarcticum]
MNDEASRGFWAWGLPFRLPRPPAPNRGWRPVALRPPYLAALVCLMLTMLLCLEGLRQYSDREGGLVFFDYTDDVSALQSFAYNYVPIIISLVLVLIWTVTDFDVLRLEPYFQLSRPEGAPASVLFINYNFGQTILTPINALRRRHWIVLWVSFVTLSIRMILPALQSTVFELREVTVVNHGTMKSWPNLVDLSTQANWMSVQANNTVDSVLSTDEQLRRSRSAQYAVAPVEIPDTDQEESTTWALDQTIYWAQVTCENVLVGDSLTVTIDDPDAEFPIISWNASGIDLDDSVGSDECTLDFHYDSVFFPATDYLQVRYWEPVISDAAKESFPNRTQAFTASGCDPYDLYGMIIGVNATNSTSTSSSTQYATSGIAFACDITYHKAEAQVNMHSNSSIMSIDVDRTTTSTLTDTEFSIEHFQALLSQRAPYTSDMLFIRENATTGGRTVTELPVISQELGELQPLLVLDTSTIMTEAEFESKIERDVKQTFVSTLGRLFDPDTKPTIVAASRFSNQVAIAVVDFAAVWSELILVSAILAALYLLYMYRSRPIFLQSDPGSIGAMCSITADIFHPSNILAEPVAEFHQFSTRQLRRIFKKARCYWRPGPGGNRLEILAEDGSPVQLDANLQTHVDPMPHFLVIPFFLVEFLALAGVIILMGLVISSLLKDGRFRHLTQGDSSSFQVVLSFLPSVVASSVGSLCTSIHRNLSVLEPWVHLQRGNVSARVSLSLNYSSQSPFAIFFKAVRDRHVLLGLVSIACVVNMALTVVAGGLFTQQMTTSTLATQDLTMNYSQSIFWRTDFAAEFTEYDLIQTSITSGVPMLPWTSPNQSFVPVHVKNRDPDVTYGATTLGVGTTLDCKTLSTDALVQNQTTGHQYWRYELYENSSVECTAAMPPLKSKDEGIALSIHFLSPDGTDDSDICQTATVLVVGRWDYLADTPITDNNTIALQCEPQAKLQEYSISFDQKGQIAWHEPVANTSITDGAMYDNATVSLGQFNKVFAAIPNSFVGNTTMQNGTYNISSYDWAGFLVARLYQRDDPDFDSLNPDLLMDMTQTVFQWVYSTYFSIWRNIYLEPLVEPIQATNATITSSTWRMVPSAPSLAIALTIIAFDTIVVLLVFWTRRGRFRGPRMPRSIGAVIPWISHSQMLNDFADTHTWSSAKRHAHLTTLNKRYGFRMFMGADNRWRFAVDQEPETKPPDAPTGDSDPEADKTTSIQLQEIRSPQSPTQL